MGGALSRVSASSVLLILAAAAQAAETMPAGLDYVVGAGVQRCPTRAEFEALLAREVGEDPFASNRALGVRIELTPRSTGVSGVVVITENGEERGRRELRSGDCAALAAALALVVGVELDPLAMARRSQGGDRVAGAQTAAAPQVQQTVETVKPPPRGDLLMSLGGMAAGNIAPTVVPAVTLGLSGRWSALPHWLELGVEWQGAPPVNAPLGLGPGSSGSVAHLLLTGLACFNPWSFLGGCAVATGGVTLATGQFQNVEEFGTQTAGYFAAGLRVQSGFPLNRDLRLVIHVDGAFQVTQEPLQICTAPTRSTAQCPPPSIDVLWSPPPFSWGIGFALQGRIL
jgi:hypothetical protein